MTGSRQIEASTLIEAPPARHWSTPRRRRYPALVIDDREIWACADLLLKQLGDHAWFVASQRADELLAVGEMEGHRTFVRILNRIKHLEALVPADALH